MRRQFLRTLATPAVQAEQQRAYGRAHVPAPAAGVQPLGAEEQAFVAARDSFYLASVGEGDWPYIQHRGGPPGFVQVVSPTELVFGDYAGNRQLISTGNVRARRRVALFFMDYAARERLKMIGEAEILTAAEAEARGYGIVVPPRTVLERVFRVTVTGYDWNCPKFITPRFTADEVQQMVAPLQARIAALETQLRARADGAGPVS